MYILVISTSAVQPEASSRRYAGVLDEDVESGAGEKLGRHQSRYFPDCLMSQGVEFAEAAEPDNRGDRLPQPRTSRGRA